jgi:hypothetical protein
LPAMPDAELRATWQDWTADGLERLLIARSEVEDAEPKMAANQPRVPAGSPEGGQWADGGGGGSGGAGTQSHAVSLSSEAQQQGATEKLIKALDSVKGLPPTHIAGLRVVVTDVLEGATGSYTGGILALPRDAGRATVLHEIGHHVWQKASPMLRAQAEAGREAIFNMPESELSRLWLRPNSQLSRHEFFADVYRAAANSYLNHDRSVWDNLVNHPDIKLSAFSHEFERELWGTGSIGDAPQP